MWRSRLELVGLVVFVLGLVWFAAVWGSRWSDGDPCFIQAPMEQAQCRAVGPRVSGVKSFLTGSGKWGIMIRRGLGSRKGW